MQIQTFPELRKRVLAPGRWDENRYQRLRLALSGLISHADALAQYARFAYGGGR